MTSVTHSHVSLVGWATLCTQYAVHCTCCFVPLTFGWSSLSLGGHNCLWEDIITFGWSLIFLGGHYWLYLSPGGPGLEVCGSGSGQGVPMGLPAGLAPGFSSPLHPRHL